MSGIQTQGAEAPEGGGGGEAKNLKRKKKIGGIWGGL